MKDINENNQILLQSDYTSLTTKPKFKLYSSTIQLQGHQGEIFTGKFSNEGFLFSSAGYDKIINIWETFHESCRNLTTLTGHGNAILELAWSQDDSKIFSASADKTVCVWDIFESKRVKKFKGHESFVNSVDGSRKDNEVIVSGGEDCQVIIWDLRSKTASHSERFKYQVTAVKFNNNADQVFIGGIDNQIKIYDLKKNQVESTLIGHLDTITGLSLSNDGNYLLSNSMDQSLRCWDIRPFALGTRCIKVFQGHSHNFEKNLLRCSWNSEDSLISAGSADRFTYIWDFATGRIERKLGGHNGSVNETSFNKLDNILSSVSSDQQIIIGEY